MLHQDGSLSRFAASFGQSSLPTTAANPFIPQPSAFFIHSIHFSLRFSTVFYLTPNGPARYFNYRKARHAASAFATADFQ